MNVRRSAFFSASMAAGGQQIHYMDVGQGDRCSRDLASRNHVRRDSKGQVFITLSSHLRSEDPWSR
jgi:hypothetical protein